MNEKLFLQALESMEESFTSNEFAEEARRLGVSKSTTASGACGLFLHRHAIQGVSRKLWSKKEGERLQGSLDLEDGANEQYCIDYLKSRGYKVIKPVSEWAEV